MSDKEVKEKDEIKDFNDNDEKYEKDEHQENSVNNQSQQSHESNQSIFSTFLGDIQNIQNNSNFQITHQNTNNDIHIQYPNPPSKRDPPTFGKISKLLKEIYNDEDSVLSTSLDILALYLKGQKILYTESKTFCEKKLNSLMLPAIFISAVCALLNFILQSYTYGSIVTACLNTINSFLLSLITFLKLDAKAEAHKSTAYKLEKLEASCEFKSGKILIFKSPKDIEEIETTLKEIETKVLDIKESNQFIIPDSVRNRYPTIYSTNIFAVVKEIRNKEILVINEFKNRVNKLYELSVEKEQIQYFKNVSDVNIKLRKDEIEQIERRNKEIVFYSNIDLESGNITKKEIIDIHNHINKIKLELIENRDIQNLRKELDEEVKLNEKYENEIWEIECKINIYEKFKDEAFNNAINFRQEFLTMGKIFRDEIEKNIEEGDSSCFLCCLDWCKT